MTYKIGRNDPCPCGSGKKYKQCCANSLADLVEPERKGHTGAVERAIEWLTNKHRKAVSVAISEMLFDELSPEDEAALKAQDPETWTSIQINATEWLLAEGEILVHGEPEPVSEYLLGQGGPLFTVDQRRWITQLAERPLRLYDVTDVVPGQQLTLCDSLDAEAPPIIVHERSGSQAALLGVQIGVRIMAVDGHYELSGAIYAFSHLTGPAVAARIREAMHLFDGQGSDLPHLLSSIIQRQWLTQFFRSAANAGFQGRLLWRAHVADHGPLSRPGLGGLDAVPVCAERR
jgi:Predicted metal-binding protein related to the C-terminal domain of SecA